MDHDIAHVLHIRPLFFAMDVSGRHAPNQPPGIKKRGGGASHIRPLLGKATPASSEVKNPILPFFMGSGWLDEYAAKVKKKKGFLPLKNSLSGFFFGAGGRCH